MLSKSPDWAHVPSFLPQGPSSQDRPHHLRAWLGALPWGGGFRMEGVCLPQPGAPRAAQLCQGPVGQSPAPQAGPPRCQAQSMTPDPGRGRRHLPRPPGAPGARESRQRLEERDTQSPSSHAKVLPGPPAQTHPAPGALLPAHSCNTHEGCTETQSQAQAPTCPRHLCRSAPLRGGQPV